MIAQASSFTRVKNCILQNVTFMLIEMDPSGFEPETSAILRQFFFDKTSSKSFHARAAFYH